MRLIIKETKEEMGRLAAVHARDLINIAIKEKGKARILL